MSFEPRVDGRSLEASYNLTAQLRLEMMERRREEEVRSTKRIVHLTITLGESTCSERERGEGQGGEREAEAAEQPGVGEHQGGY